MEWRFRGFSKKKFSGEHIPGPTKKLATSALDTRLWRDNDSRVKNRPTTIPKPRYAPVLYKSSLFVQLSFVFKVQCGKRQVVETKDPI